MRATVVTTICWLLTGAVQGAEPVDYLRDVKPLLKERCFACHGVLKQEAELRLDTAALIRQGGERGPAIVPGDSAGSTLIEAMWRKRGQAHIPEHRRKCACPL